MALAVQLRQAWQSMTLTYSGGLVGCDMSCTPIDSGVLFLLIGGGLFGGFMIKRRRETELMPLAAK